MYICICIYVHMYICIYVNMFICIYVSFYICINVYMYIYIYMAQRLVVPPCPPETVMVPICKCRLYIHIRK